MKKNFILMGLACSLLCGFQLHAWADETLIPARRPTRSIMAGDRIRISVAESPDLNKVYAVAGDGTIDFGFIGRISISELSATEAETKIKKMLEESYFKEATVKLDVAQFVEGNVLVQGAVARPGTVAMSGDTILTLLEAIAMTGGLTDNAAGDQVHILRWTYGGGLQRQIITVDMRSMLESLDFSKDQFMRPRDIVIVPTLGASAAGEFLALGEVNELGYHPVQEGMTMIRVIAAVGGVTHQGKMESARLIRQDKNGQTKIIPVDLQRLLGSGDMSMNIPVFGGDILFVPSNEQAAGGKVYFLGAVERQGSVSLNLDKEATLARTILGMGGLGKFADGTEVEILRTGPDGAKQRQKVNVDRILKSGAFEDDIPLKDGDVIKVPERIFLP